MNRSPLAARVDNSKENPLHGRVTTLETPQILKHDPESTEITSARAAVSRRSNRKRRASRRRRDARAIDARCARRILIILRVTPRVGSHRAVHRPTSPTTLDFPLLRAIERSRAIATSIEHRTPRETTARRTDGRDDYKNTVRTWTLVALKAATRPTKEEARRADIVLCVCWNAVDRARWDGIAFVPNVRSYRAHQYSGSPSPVRDHA